MNTRKKIAVVFGTRPEVIKMLPVIRTLDSNPNFELSIINTGQHVEMLNPLIDLFNIRVDYCLNIMKDGQTLCAIAEKLFGRINSIYEKEKPHFVLVQGDTITTLAAALSAFYQRIPVGHIEAGLRTYNNNNPFPEEANRRMISSIADLHFVPSENSKNNLQNEHVPSNKIFFTGNTIIDSLKIISENETLPISTFAQNIIDTKEKLILVTVHRRENWGKPLESIIKGIKKLSDELNGFRFVIPMHKNKIVRNEFINHLSEQKNVLLTEPFEYVDLIKIIKNSYLVLTDSGGIQEEAPALGKPVLILREYTERPEAVEAGISEIVGTDQNRIYLSVQNLIRNQKEYLRRASVFNPYGDGKAAVRIQNILESYFRITNKQKNESKLTG